jgi:phage FluMu gp28-like protein
VRELEKSALITQPRDVLLEYQLRWADDPSRFKIGLMARQTGKSFGGACEIVEDSLRSANNFWVVLSAGERQSLEFMEKVKQWSEAYSLAVTDYDETRDNPQALIKAAELRWSNGSRVLALPANPATARGYSANLFLDEFAFHEKPDEIWRAIYPSISNPLKRQFKLRIVSTANGKANKFYDLWSTIPTTRNIASPFMTRSKKDWRRARGNRRRNSSKNCGQAWAIRKAGPRNMNATSSTRRRCCCRTN